MGLELDSHPSDDLRALDAHLAHYAPLFDAHVGCDVVHPAWDLSGYSLVVVPNLYLLDTDVAARLTAYVADGGHLVVSFFSGIVDSADRAHLGGHPAPLREVLGLRVDEFAPLPPAGTIDVTSADGSVATGRIWSEWIETEGAEPLATFTNGELAGRPAVTRNAHGAGTAWYLGTRLDPVAMRTLFDTIRAEAGVAPTWPDLPDEVQASLRHGEDHDYLILLNHGDTPATVALAEPAPDLLAGSGTEVGEVTLPHRGVAVLRVR